MSGCPEREDVGGTSPPHKQTSHAKQPHPSARTLVVRCALWGAAHAAEIHYAETRPIPIQPAHHLPALPLTTDCSGFVTVCYRYAGAPDPNGLHYGGEGYTGTLLGHMREVRIGQARPGDVVVYGCRSNPSGHHAALVVGRHASGYSGIVTVSHGQESGPFEITVAEEADWQPDGLSGVRFLSLLP